MIMRPLAIKLWSKESLSLREDAFGTAIQLFWTVVQKFSFVIEEAKKMSGGKKLTITQHKF